MVHFFYCVRGILAYDDSFFLQTGSDGLKSGTNLLVLKTIAENNSSEYYLYSALVEPFFLNVPGGSLRNCKYNESMYSIFKQWQNVYGNLLASNMAIGAHRKMVDNVPLMKPVGILDFHVVQPIVPVSGVIKGLQVQGPVKRGVSSISN